MTTEHPLKGKKKSAATIAKMKETWAKKRAEKANGHAAASTNNRDAVVYLRTALAKWPVEKKRDVHRVLVELALLTLEGKA